MLSQVQQENYDCFSLPFYNCINVDIKVLYYHEFFFFTEESK